MKHNKEVTNGIGSLEEIPGFISKEEEDEINRKLDIEEGIGNEEPIEKENEDKNKKSSKKSKNTNTETEDESEKEKEFEDEVNRQLDLEEEETGNGKKSKAGDSEKDSENASMRSTIEYLRKKKLIDYDDPEESEEPYTEEESYEILEEAIESRIQEGVQDLIQGLDDTTKSIIKYALDGGDAISLLEKLANKKNSRMSNEIDLNKPEDQKMILREVLKNEGYDEDEIESQIEYYEDAGKLQSFATKRYNAWKKQADKEYEEELAAQEERKRQAVAKFKQQRSEFNEYLQGLDSVGEMGLSRRDKSELVSYLMDRNVKLENGGSITNFHADLSEVMQNRKASIQLAKILRARNKDGLFNFDEIREAVKTEVTDKLKRTFRRTNNEVPRSSSGSSGKGKSLIELLS